MIGQTYSTSHNACMIEFKGGPYHGRSGLYDHNAFDSIQFADMEKKVTHSYRPLDKWRSCIYVYDGPHAWN